MANPNNPTHRTAPAAWAIPGGPGPEMWDAPAPSTPGSLTPQLARTLLDEHSKPGDLVLDLGDDIALAATAAEMHRRHHALRGDIATATRGHTAGYVDLMLLPWPLVQGNPRQLLAAGRTLLRDPGFLAVAVTAAPQRLTRLTELSGAAHATGLRVRRHIAVVDPSRATVTYVGTPGGAIHATAWPHTDLLLLAPVGSR